MEEVYDHHEASVSNNDSDENALEGHNVSQKMDISRKTNLDSALDPFLLEHTPDGESVSSALVISEMSTPAGGEEPKDVILGVLEGEMTDIMHQLDDITTPQEGGEKPPQHSLYKDGSMLECCGGDDPEGIMEWKDTTHITMIQQL